MKERIPKRLKNSPLFVRMSDEELDKILSVVHQVDYAAGKTIVQEGELGDALYFLLKGSVRIVKKRNGVEHVLGVLKEDDFFGEMSLIDLQPRSASVVAKESATLLRFQAEDLALVFSEDTEILALLITNIARVLSRRLRGANERIVSFLEKETSD